MRKTLHNALSRGLFLGTIACFLTGWPQSGHGPNANAQDVAHGREREVTFGGANRVKLAGTLLIPVHEPDAKVPGVIIVAGSGPTDRNGNQAGLTTNLYKQIA